MWRRGQFVHGQESDSLRCGAMGCADVFEIFECPQMCRCLSSFEQFRRLTWIEAVDETVRIEAIEFTGFPNEYGA